MMGNIVTVRGGIGGEEYRDAQPERFSYCNRVPKKAADRPTAGRAGGRRLSVYFQPRSTASTRRRGKERGPSCCTC